MTTDEKLEIFLELQLQGYTPADIANKLEMQEKALRNLLRRKNYTCIDGKYVPKDGSEPKTKSPAPGYAPAKPAIDKPAKTTTTNIKKDNIEKDIKDIKEMLSAIKEIKDIKDMLLEIKETTYTENNIDEVSITAEPNPVTGNEISINELKHFSIRADNDTLNEFHELCKKYPNINKSYMFTLALKEFVNNHS